MTVHVAVARVVYWADQMVVEVVDQVAVLVADVLLTLTDLVAVQGYQVDYGHVAGYWKTDSPADWSGETDYGGPQ